MNLCKCGCGTEVRWNYKRGHSGRGQKSPLNGRTKGTYKYLKIKSDRMIGKTKETHEYLRLAGEKISKKLKGRNKYNNEGYRRTSEKLKGRTQYNNESVRKRTEKRIGRTKYNDEGVRRQAEKMKGKRRRNDITKEKIKITIEDICKNNKNIKFNELQEEICKKFMCSTDTIKNRNNNKNLTSVLEELNIQVKPTSNWKKKENLGIKLCKELFGEGLVQQHYKEYRSRPDFVGDNIVVDIKSSLNDISIDQFIKYQNIKEDVKIMAFKKEGKTELREDRILYMRDMIETLPDSKKQEFKRKWHMIDCNIKVGQTNLASF